MNPQSISTQNPGFNLGDLYYLIFRHKWKIIVCSIAGIAAAISFVTLQKPMYQSEAKLLVRYIISESKPSGPGGAESNKITLPDERGATVMNTEVEILKSEKIARQVAESIGPENILAKAGAGKDLTAAAALISGGLAVRVPQNSVVIDLTFKHPDPQLVQPILAEIVRRYLELHLEAHRSAGMLGDTLTTETDQLRTNLLFAEDELSKALGSLGVVSVEETKKSLSEQMTSIRREILGYQAELAGKTAILESLRKRLPTTPQSVKIEPGVALSADIVDDYRSASRRVEELRKVEQDLLLQFTPDSERVKALRIRIIEAEQLRTAILEKYPQLSGMSAFQAQAAPDPLFADAATTETQITAYEAKIKELGAQLDAIRAEMVKLDRMEGNIADLRRKKERLEHNYRFWADKAEQARIDDRLGNGKVSNITAVQPPSPPYRLRADNKKAGLVAIGGIGIGLAWAFLIEMYLDRSIRRASEIDRLLRVPLFLSIPKLRPAGQVPSPSPRPGLPAGEIRSAGQVDIASGEAGPPSVALQIPVPDQQLSLFHETLRDRLVGYFESKGLTHKPKLVALAGLASKAGVTTTAAGLARSLSEIGDGNVLFVDMTASQGASQQFVKGRSVCGLDELLDSRDNAHVQDRLYVVSSENSNSDRLSRNLPQRFTKLVPKLKASDFDYIIFDMPPVNQISITPRLASFMDMVLLVVESEKNDRDMVQRATSLLGESGAHVGVVLNKTRNYVPARLHQEFLGG